MRGSLQAVLPVIALIPSSIAVNYDVTVGKGAQLKFDPETLNAAVGDTVTYHFFSKVSARRAAGTATERPTDHYCRTIRWCNRRLTVCE